MKSTVPLILLLIVFFSCKKDKLNNENILDVIESHYAFGKDISALSIEYKRLNFNPYQSYDYRNPDSLFSSNSVDLDLENREFYAHSKASFPGDYTFSTIEFQTDSLSVGYDNNGILFGKTILIQDLNRIDAITNSVDTILDFRLVNTLLSLKDSLPTEAYIESDTAFILQINRKQDSTLYKFSIDPIKLFEIEHKSSNDVWKFDDLAENESFAYTSKITRFRNDEFRDEIIIKKLQIIDAIASDKLTIPEGYSYPVITPSNTIKSYEIAKNLFLVKPVARDRNVMFKVNNKSITVFGAPISEDFSNQVIKLINAKFPKKIISEIYVTHSHSDHIGGLLPYVENNAKILTDQYSIEAIKAYPKFQDNIERFNFEIISNNAIKNGVQYFIPKNPHILGQSFAYFINSKIIYQGDFLEIPADNTKPSYTPETTLKFIEFIKNKNLTVKRIVGHHRNDNIALEFIN